MIRSAYDLSPDELRDWGLHVGEKDAGATCDVLLAAAENLCLALEQKKAAEAERDRLIAVLRKIEGNISWDIQAALQPNAAEGVIHQGQAPDEATGDGACPPQQPECRHPLCMFKQDEADSCRYPDCPFAQQGEKEQPGRRRCQACECGEHWDCGRQSWCECECEGAEVDCPPERPEPLQGGEPEQEGELVDRSEIERFHVVEIPPDAGRTHAVYSNLDGVMISKSDCERIAVCLSDHGYRDLTAGLVGLFELIRDRVPADVWSDIQVNHRLVDAKAALEGR